MDVSELNLTDAERKQNVGSTEENLSLSNPVVTILEDEDDGDLSTDDLSLREAILYSKNGDRITFDSSLRDGTILLTSGTLSIDKSLTIKGFEDSNLTIDGNNQHRVFNISDRIFYKEW